MNLVQETQEQAYFLEYPNNYIGEQKNGVYQGKGKLELPNQESTLIGNFRKGYFSSGSINFQDGKKITGKLDSKSELISGVIENDDLIFNSFIDEGYISERKYMIEFKNGDTFKGNYSDRRYISEGEFEYKLPDGSTKKVKLELNGIGHGMKVGDYIKYFEYGSKVERFTFLSEDQEEGKSIKIKMYELIFKNGDRLVGEFEKFDFNNLNFIGKITYSEDRFPPFEGKIIDNKPISGEGTCYLYNVDILYRGKFSKFPYQYSITESDGTFHSTESLIDKKHETIKITYQNGKKFRGSKLLKSKYSNRYIEGQGYLKLKNSRSNIAFEGIIKSKTEYKGKWINLDTGVSHEYESYSGCQLNYYDAIDQKIKIRFEDTKEEEKDESVLEILKGQLYNFEGSRYSDIYENNDCRDITKKRIENNRLIISGK